MGGTITQHNKVERSLHSVNVGLSKKKAAQRMLVSRVNNGVMAGKGMPRMTRTERRLVKNIKISEAEVRRSAQAMVDEYHKLSCLCEKERMLEAYRLNHVINTMLVVTDYYMQDMEEGFKWLNTPKVKKLIREASTANNRLLEALRTVNFRGDTDEYNRSVMNMLDMADIVKNIAMFVHSKPFLLEVASAVKLAAKPSLRKEVDQYADMIRKDIAKSLKQNIDYYNQMADMAEKTDDPAGEMHRQMMREMGVDPCWRLTVEE